MLTWSCLRRHRANGFSKMLSKLLKSPGPTGYCDEDSTLMAFLLCAIDSILAFTPAIRFSISPIEAKRLEAAASTLSKASLEARSSSLNESNMHAYVSPGLLLCPTTLTSIAAGNFLSGSSAFRPNKGYSGMPA